MSDKPEMNTWPHSVALHGMTDECEACGVYPAQVEFDMPYTCIRYCRGCLPAVRRMLKEGYKALEQEFLAEQKLHCSQIPVPNGLQPLEDLPGGDGYGGD